ncbi:glycosyltransferase [Proteiniborus sp. MB09-C3]|uniref:glycosyltransferase family protein n=1 Tax=Proteiniborus sp. MB09-C3 TaxID=3050072 RepID=UPI0025551FBB|nr:glycosyltransferase [Proteiniborus sp. MB09-C3]WIV12039.1 glycosyltransferase [Proteiniborus sp. MB09-C3]
MDNILLIFLNDLQRIDEFNKIINEFDRREYKMYLYDNIRSEDFDFSQLPDIVEYYKKQHNNVNKIVILSNLRDLTFAWYRCYNSIVDDFVYFIDEEGNNYFDINDRHFDFYYNLYEFNYVEKETIEGKIYLNKEDEKVLPIYYEQKYFDFFSEIDLFNKIEKKSLNKKYTYSGFEYCFNSNKGDRWENIEIGKINKRIVFFKGQSQYDVLRVGTDYRAKFYKQLGFEVYILDLLEPNVVSKINTDIINKKCDFIYSSNCIGIDIKLSDGRNLYDTLDIPFLGTLGDHPVNQLSRIINSPQKTLFTCIDEENIEYFKKYFPSKKIILSNCSGYPAANYAEKKFNEREIDVLFAGSLIDPVEIKKSWDKLDEKFRLIINYLSDLAIKEKFLINIDDEISKFLLKHNIINDDFGCRALIHSQVERYVRVYKRYELVKKIGESDLNIVCLGNVEEYNKLNKSGKLIIKSKVDYKSLLEMMNNSKMVLNITGHLYNGVTERVLSAMINGAVAVTEKDRFTNKYFKDGENIILYDLDTVIDKIKYYQKNINELEKIALNGQREAMNKYDYRISICTFIRHMKSL